MSEPRYEPEPNDEPEMFQCWTCGKDARIEVTFPDGAAFMLCRRDAPKSGAAGVSVVDTWARWRGEMDGS